jgi:hypothetical protein
MRFQKVFLTSLLPIISAVTATSLDAWTEIALQASSNVVKLNDKNFDQLITPERNYTSVSATLFLDLD